VTCHRFGHRRPVAAVFRYTALRVSTTPVFHKRLRQVPDEQSADRSAHCKASHDWIVDAHFGFRFDPRFQGIFRVDTWDPDIARETNAANATERDYVAGFNYFIREKYFKLQFNYLRKTFTNGLVPSRNVLFLNLQTWW
jgi:hypothetical protein